MQFDFLTYTKVIQPSMTLFENYSYLTEVSVRFKLQGEGSWLASALILVRTSTNLLYIMQQK